MNRTLLLRRAIAPMLLILFVLGWANPAAAQCTCSAPAAPTFTSAIPADVTIQADASICTGVQTFSLPNAVDCNNAPVLVTTNATGFTFAVGVHVISFTAADACGATTETFSITVEDSEDPIAQCVPDNSISLSLDGGGNAMVSSAAVDNGSSDNCSISSYALSQSAFTCVDTGMQTITLTVADPSGNSSMCTTIIEVKDEVNPMALCNSVSVTLGAMGTAEVWAGDIDGGSTDNCTDIDLMISSNDTTYAAKVDLDCDDIPSTTLYLQVSDASGNSSTCSVSIPVSDATAPMVMTAPATPIEVECDEIPAIIDPVFSDNCTVTSVTLDSTDTPGACANEYVRVRTWTATDGTNPMTFSQTINVSDNKVPTFSMASAYEADNSTPYICGGALGIEVTADSVSDNCSNFAGITLEMMIDFDAAGTGYTDIASFVAYDAAQLDTFPVGVSTVTLRATDACGKSATHVVTVTVNDVDPPTFGGLIGARCGTAVVLPNVANTCNNSLSWVRPNGSDLMDCQASTTFTVTESIDATAVQSSVNSSFGVYDYQTADGTNSAVNAVFPVGVTTVTYTADDGMNTSTCSFTVEIEDTQVPIVTCPSQQILQSTCPDQNIPSYANDISISDNCPNSSVTITQTPSTTAELGDLFVNPGEDSVFTVKMHIVDSGMNMDSCTFTVILKDGDAPIPQQATLALVVNRCGSVIVPAPVATDACNPVDTLIYGTPSGQFDTLINANPPIYNFTYAPGQNNYVITWSYDDGFGNVSTQVQTISVLPDTFPATALCKNITVPLQADGDTTLIPAQIDNGSFDQDMCGPISLSISPNYFTCAELDTNVVTLTVTDNTGNTSICTADVVIVDNTPPVFVPAIEADTFIQACEPVPPAQVVVGEDVCAGTFVVDFTEDTIFTSQYNYTLIRTWAVSDSVPNINIATQVVTVRDTQSPSFGSSPDTLYVSTGPDVTTCSDSFTVDLSAFISDCSPFDSLILNPMGGIWTAVYSPSTSPYNVTFNAIDESGNPSSHDVAIFVSDGTPPIASCKQGISLNLSPNGSVTIPNESFVDNGSWDNCGPIASRTLSQYTFTCTDISTSNPPTVTLTVTDGAGNSASCVSFIEIQDNVAPPISCPADGVADCSASTAVSIYGSASATDNCGGSIVILHVDEIVAGTGAYCQQLERTWSATDQYNNINTCLQTISIFDTLAPVITGVQTGRDTQSCEIPLPAAMAGQVTDNCTQNLSLTFTQDTINPICGTASFTVRRVWEAMDSCGNTARKAHLITLLDTIAPVFVGIADTIQYYTGSVINNAVCGLDIDLDLYDFVDECSDSSTIVVTNDALSGNGAFDVSGFYGVGFYEVGFDLEDGCGNSAVDTIRFQIKDNTTPQPDCIDQIVVALDSDGQGDLDTTQVNLGSTDNCGIDTMYLSQSEFDCSDLGVQMITMTVVDINGNMNSCAVQVDVQAGATPLLSASIDTDTTSSFGAGDGELTVTVSGGSANYSFAWSSGGSSAVESNLDGGTYTVTISDDLTGCEMILTGVVEEGNGITLIAGNVTGPAGGTAEIPVTSLDFTNIEKLQFSIQGIDVNVAEVTGISNAHPSFNNGLVGIPSGGNNLFLLWDGLGSTATFLPTDVLFTIQVNVTGSVGDMSGVSFSPNIEFPQNNNGVSDSIPVTTIDGSIIVGSNSNVQIAGSVTSWDNPELAGNQSVSVPTADVFLSGVSTTATDASGNYTLDVPFGSTNTVNLEKFTAGSAGINGGDLLRIVNQMLGGDAFPTGYHWVAADVNNDGQVTVSDITKIQRLVLGSVQHLDSDPDWIFVPSDYVFPTTANPISSGFPSSRDYTNLMQDMLTEDYIGIRRGDVNGNAPVSLVVADDRYDNNEIFVLQTVEQSAEAGSVIQVPITAQNFVDKKGYQMTMHFNPEVLELSDIQSNGLDLTEENFGKKFLGQGDLTTLWFDNKARTFNQEDKLFTLSFKVTENMPSLASVLNVSSDITKAEAYDEKGENMRLRLDYVLPVGGVSYELEQNRPNPFRTSTTLGFHLPKADKATIRIMDATGRLIKTIQGDYAKGLNQIEVFASELGQAGIYWYELETSEFTDRKKMVVFE